MKMNLRVFCICAFFFFVSFGLCAQSDAGNVQWISNDIFGQKTFIKNEGQFDQVVRSKKVLYGAYLGDAQVFFCENEVIYRCNRFKEEGEGEEEEREDDEAAEVDPAYFHCTWNNYNHNAYVEAVEEADYYYTYGTKKGTGIRANVFRRLIYHDMYPGVDVTYILPEAGGLKYTITVHPGADLSVVELLYDDANTLQVDANGNLVMECEVGTITDHAPVCWYDTHEDVAVRFAVDGHAIHFTGNYDHSKTLIIDPWTTSPGFNSYNSAYDVAYDYSGNVYAYGGGNPFQLVKMDANGTILWTFNLPTYTITDTQGYKDLGDFTVNPLTQSVYIGQGFSTAGASITKLDGQGMPFVSSPINPNINEIWRIEYNLCTNQLVIGAGDIYSGINACTIDSNFTNAVFADVFATGLVQRDVALLALDPAGDSCYVASARTLNQTNGNGADNIMLQCPLPGLLPTTYSVYDGYLFQEKAIPYIGSSAVQYRANGFNGMAASKNYLYTYDGATLKKWNKSTGALQLAIATGGTAMLSGGLAVDDCENIYVASGQVIMKYNSMFILQSSSVAPGTIYDLQLGRNNKLYVCGSGFVLEMNVASSFTVTATAVQPTISCGCTGAATVNVSCGNPSAYLYEWDNGGTTQTVSGLCAGTHTVTVHTSCSMFYTDTVIIATYPPVDVVPASQTHVSCNGGSDGSATVNAQSGVPVFAYSWSPAVSTSNTASNLSAGTYTCTMSDSTGCTDSVVITITEPPALSALITATSASCGMSNGAATITTSGGTGPYAFTWSPVGGNQATANNLPVGTYQCAVIDANGCTIADSVNITSAPGPAIAVASVTNVSCAGACDGSTTVNASGGNGNYVYVWTPSGGNASTASNLCATSYTCTVTDAGGCADSISVTITEPLPLVVSVVSSTNELCYGDSSGSASVNVMGGNGNYTYSWSPYGIGASPANLSAGSFTCTVTDANSCTANVSILVTSPPAITSGYTSTSETCAAKNAIATVNANGGTGNFSYTWSTIPVQTGTTADSLAGGTYVVTITDANGCIAYDTVIINSIPVSSATLSAVDVLCNGSCNGSAALTMNGTGPFTYAWSSGGTSSNESGLCAGNYNVIYIDGNNCTDTVFFMIAQPAVLAASIVASPNPVCAGQPVSISSTANGGIAPYTYNWSTGGTTASINDSPTATTSYSVQVDDANGCTTATAVTVNVNALPDILFIADQTQGCAPVCVSFTDNSSPGSTFNWDFGDGNISSVQNPMHCYSDPGQYDVTLSVTDNNGCTGSSTSQNFITVFPVPSAGFVCSPQVTDILDPAVFFTDHSVGATSWQWNFGNQNGTSALQNPNYAYPDTGLYQVVQTVTNSYGCSATATQEVYIGDAYAFYAPTGFTPNGDGINDEWFPQGTDIAEDNYDLMIFDRWGNLIFETTDPHKGWDGHVKNGSEVAQQDVYVWKVKLHARENEMIKVFTGHVALVK